ncbi:MAG: histidine kinase, partial [Saprospiraceae bacterium]|nr:histidine kinase [Saprospiraceae bacterium]
MIKNDTRKASEYLSNFARLIRLILQNSRSNYVNLRDEIEALQLYMGMEQLRFRNKF